MTMNGEGSDLNALVDAIRAIATATTATIAQDEGISDRLLALLVAAGRVRSTLDVMVILPATLNLLAALTGDVIESVLPEIIFHDVEHVADIRRFFLQPKEAYGIADLARLWQITPDDVRDIYHDERTAFSDADLAEPDSFRIAWANAVGTSVRFGLLRPWDIEVALADDFDRGRSEKWRTVPIVVRLPRFIVETLPGRSRRRSLAAHLEQFVLELFQGEYRSALLRTGVEDDKDRRS